MSGAWSDDPIRMRVDGDQEIIADLNRRPRTAQIFTDVAVS
jgi:hypothetical protein